jgi:hypothetical protein
MSISNRDNSLRSARSLGQLNGTKAFNDFVGKKDRLDFRSFQLTQRSSLSLTASKLKSPVNIRLINQLGATIARLRPTGKRGQISLAGVEAGTYYVSVARGRKDTRYRLGLTATAAPLLPPGPSPNPNPSPNPSPNPNPTPTGDNTPGTARNLGTLASGTRNYQDYVGDLDTIDYYKFNTTAITDFNANISGLSSGVYLYLYRDNNNNGQIDSTERVDYEYTTTTDNISQILTKGTYFFAVEKYGSTTYNLTLTTTAYPTYTPTPEPGATTSTARNLGALAGTFTTKDYVGNLDSTDYYKFSVNAVSDFNANISGLADGVYLYLYRDNNNNGQIDTNERVDYEYATSTDNISQILTKGTYFFAVEKYGSTRYDLNLTATPYSSYTSNPDPGDTASTARNLGTLSGTFTAKDYVGNLDNKDFYKFTVSGAKPAWNLNANLTTLNGGAYMYLYRDNNLNGQIDSGERIDYEYVSTTDSISRSLTPGNYFLSVDKYDSTRYDLNLQVT